VADVTTRSRPVAANGMMADEKRRAIMSTPNAEWTEAKRQEVFAEALHHPETAEERAAQQATFRQWRADPRFQHLWPMIERLIEADEAPAVNGAEKPAGAVAS